MRAASPILLLCIVFTSLISVAQHRSCATVTADTAESKKLLEEQSSIRQSGCITPAIKRLGSVGDSKAIHVLVSYLDYVDPATAPNPSGGADEPPSYPAVGALFQIGTPATSDLLEAVQNDNPVIGKNAAITYLSVYRDDLPLGIRLVLGERSKATDPGAQKRLSHLAQTLLKDCSAQGADQARQCTMAAKNE
jgi:hypothetical protein